MTKQTASLHLKMWDMLETDTSIDVLYDGAVENQFSDNDAKEIINAIETLQRHAKEKAYA